MGCTQSKIENEEAVSRCKDRKQFMSEAVNWRNAFAAAQSSYNMSLKNTGAALSDFSHAELPHHSANPPLSSGSFASSLLPPPPSGLDSLPLPPPPLPPHNFQSSPLQRAASMPEMKIQKPDQPLGPAAIPEDEEMEFDNDRLVRNRSGSSSSRGGGGAVQTETSSRLHVQRLMRSSPPAQVVQQEPGWDFFFFPPVESMTGPTLADPEPVEQVAVRVNREEVVESKVFEEMPKRVEEEEEEPPKAVEEEVERAVEVPTAVQEKVAVKKAGGEGGRRVGKTFTLIQIFGELDDHFLKASESAHEVSKMLEAPRLHYHSNFADNRGHIDHSARVMRVITWNRSFRGIPNIDDGMDDFSSEEHENHATVLDKMLAWEKKLYDEVKAGEHMKFEYQKKVNSLNKHKKRGTNPESLEKLKAAVSLLHTRYIVDMQSLDSTVAEINRLRDEQLYPILVQLVDGMTIMWETMQGHHEAQSKIVNALRFWDYSQYPKETTEHHHNRTCQLWAVAQQWHEHFCKLIDNQKLYIKALDKWLKLNLIPIESNLREKVSSPPRVENPPIQALLLAWHDYLDTLSDDYARAAINKFVAAVHTIIEHQEEEMKLKEKCEETRKELARKTRHFEDWHRKYMERRIPDELDPERAEENTRDDAVVERQNAVEVLKKRLEEEEDDHLRLCHVVREKSLASLKACLPELFRAMSDVSQACAEMYGSLRDITERQNAS